MAITVSQQAQRFDDDYIDIIAIRCSCEECNYQFLILINENKLPRFCPMCGKGGTLEVED